jgi:hypothetical protein
VSLVRKVSPKKAASPASRRATARAANPGPKANVVLVANPANLAPKAIAVLAVKIARVARSVRASRSSPS